MAEHNYGENATTMQKLAGTNGNVPPDVAPLVVTAATSLNVDDRVVHATIPDTTAYSITLPAAARCAHGTKIAIIANQSAGGTPAKIGIAFKASDIVAPTIATGAGLSAVGDCVIYENVAGERWILIASQIT